MVDQIHGGESPNRTLRELQDVGVSVIMHGTPCVLAAHDGMEESLDMMPAARVRRGKAPGSAAAASVPAAVAGYAGSRE